VSSLLDDVNQLLNQNKGDSGRLQHIKDTLEKNKTLYISDRQYVTTLMKNLQNLGDSPKSYSSTIKSSERTDNELHSDNENVKKNNDTDIPQNNTATSSNVNSFCRKCGNVIKKENFCTKCGSSVNLNNNQKYDSSHNDDISPKYTIHQQIKKKSFSKKEKILTGITFVLILIISAMMTPNSMAVVIIGLIGIIITFVILSKSERRITTIGIMFIIFSVFIMSIPMSDEQTTRFGNSCKELPNNMNEQTFEKGSQELCYTGKSLSYSFVLVGIAGLILTIYGIIKKI
jgi:hypothetical protein